MFKRSFETPLGPMLAVSDETSLHYLGFDPGETFSESSAPIEQICDELDKYFKSILRVFKTPLLMKGTPFQKKVWRALQKIPFGSTKSYKDIAESIDNPLACRAVGTANGVNPFVIVVPCHRVVNANGLLGGYSAGIRRKKWLLSHEK